MQWKKANSGQIGEQLTKLVLYLWNSYVRKILKWETMLARFIEMDGCLFL